MNPSKKRCKTCSKKKPLIKFYKHPSGRFGRQPDCIKCSKKRALDRYYRNHEQNKARQRNTTYRIRVKSQRRVYRYLSKHPCMDCGETEVVVLEFDHVRGKKLDCVARMVRDCAPWSRIEKEVAKCNVVCANCHKKRHARRALWKRLLYENGPDKLIAFLREHPCQDCGIGDIEVLEFDHVRGVKLANIANLKRGPWRRLLREAKKCDVVCTNCHRRRTAKRGMWAKRYF